MKCSVLIFLGVFSISAVRALPRADEKNLAFTRRVFTYRYDGSLQHEGGAIVVTGDDFVNANITLSKNGSEEFAVSKPNAADGVITLTVPGGGALSAATLVKEVVILEIFGTRGSDTASAYIFVFLPNARSPFFKFLSKVFLGSYSTINDNQAVVTLNKDIVIDGNFDNVAVSAGDYSSNFEATIGEGGNVTLAVVERLAAQVLANNEVLVTLTATREQGSQVTDNAEVILKLPNTQEATPLHFLDTLYYFDYSEEDGTGKLTARTGIKIRADDLGAVVVTVTPADIFEAVLEASSDEVTLSLTEGTLLTEENNKEVTITIRNGDDTATVNAFVKLPNGQSKTPLHFRSNVITGKYTAEQGLTITDELFAIIAEDLNNVELALDQAEPATFEEPSLNKETGAITLALKNPNSWQQEGNQFTVKITATSDDDEVTADVIIQLPDTQKAELLLHFETNIYTAEYSDDNLINPDQAITLSNFVAETDYISTNDPKIQAKVDEFGVVTLILADDVEALTPLPEDKNKLTVTVTATSSGGIFVQADVVVKFNSIADSPLFTKNVFVQSLTSGNSIEGDEIKIDDSDDEITTVKVEVDEVYKDYLEAEIDHTTAIITLKISDGKEIPGEVLLNSQFTVELYAIADDAGGALLGSTVVVVTLPKLPNTVALHFSSNFYTADYSEDPAKGTVTVDITLLGGIGATLALDSTSAEYLEPTLKDGVVRIEVKDNKIPANNLVDKNHINAQLTATLNEQMVTADIAVKIPKEKETIPLHFSDNFYSASLTTEGNVDIADIVLKGQDLSKTNVTLVGDHANFFEARLEAEATPQLGGVVKITYVEGDDLPDQNEIVLKLTANEVGQSVSSDLVVKIPKDPVKIPLHFSSNVYSATYSEAGELTTVDGPIKIIADTLPAYQIEVDEPNRGYFKLTPNPNDEFTFALAIDALPEDLVSKNNHVIVKVTATAAGHTNVTSDVVVTLQKTVHDKPHFKRKVFVAEHTVNEEEVTVTLTVDNSIIEGHEPHKLKLEDDKKLFDATVSEAGVVDLKWAAGKDALKDEKDRIVEVKLTATDEAANKEQVTLYVVLEPRSGAFDHSGVAAVTLMMSVVWALFA